MVEIDEIANNLKINHQSDSKKSADFAFQQFLSPTEICHYLLTSPDEKCLWLVTDNWQLKIAQQLLDIFSAVFTSDKQILIWPEQSKATPSLVNNFYKLKKQIFLTTRNNLAESWYSPELIQKLILQLSLGQKIKLNDLIESFVNLGYERNTKATRLGEFAIRGDICEYFDLENNQLVRLELFGNVLETITALTPLTYEKISDLKNCQILPLNLEACEEKSLLDYVSDYLMINDFITLENKLNYSSAPLYQNKIVNLKNDLTSKFSKFQTIIISTEPKLSEYLNLPSIKIIKSTPLLAANYGFKLNNLLVLTDYDIFGRPKRQTQAKKTQIFLPEIKPGDYIVHEAHGLGQFTGLTTETISGITREYLLIQYASSDKLFLPVEQADKIDKYLGPANPTLERLDSTTTWPAKIRQAQVQALQDAAELLNLYASRSLSYAPKLLPTAEETIVRESFPYIETPDQLQAETEILADLENSEASDRLLCGDVGFGKTELAIRAAVRAATNGYQVAILCPTTILAQQHEDTFRARLKNLNIEVAGLSRFYTKKQQAQTLAEVATNKIKIIIGTHRLLSADVKFHNLGLLIIDEEQRFGVKDKERLKRLKHNVHVLTLTATPIPRTLHLALSGLRQISLLASAPEGRMPITTMISQFNEDLIKQAVLKEIARGGQVYYLYNKVESIEFAKKKLTAILPGVSIGLAHGQLPEKELAQTMHDFDSGKIQVLLCSTIIENGLDLPNANTLIVEQATNFGLSQLYQLRGRIGRSSKEAYAYFLYHSHDLPKKAGTRLRILQTANSAGSGFEIAQRDLELRGVGEILGQKQHGTTAAIGLTLYERLLEQTIADLQGQEISVPRLDVKIDLPVNANLPETIFPNASERLRLYQKLSRIYTLEELTNKEKQLNQTNNLDVKNFFTILRIKLLAESSRINQVIGKLNNDKIDLTLNYAESPNYEKISQLLKIQPFWVIKDNKLKINLNQEKNWLHFLEEAIQIISKN